MQSRHYLRHQHDLRTQDTLTSNRGRPGVTRNNPLTGADALWMPLFDEPLFKSFPLALFKDNINNNSGINK